MQVLTKRGCVRSMETTALEVHVVLKTLSLKELVGRRIITDHATRIVGPGLATARVGVLDDRPLISPLYVSL